MTTDPLELRAAALDAALLVELEALAMDLARGAGTLVVRDRPDRLSTATKSSDTDVVTEMDARAEAYLRERIRAARPGDGILGEEQERQAGTGELTWVIDPIDGTVNYLYGSSEFAVSVAVVVGDPGRAGAWLLERRYAGEFSATNRVEHSAGEVVIAIQINPPAAAATGEAVDPGAEDD